MAKIGLKGLTYAKVSGGGADSAMTYTGGKTIPDLMIAANVTINRANVRQDADNHKIESDNSITGVDVTLELARLPDDAREDLLGYEADNDGTLNVVGDAAPYVGFGYITMEVTSGVISYVAYWHHKMQFGMTDDNATTKGENLQYQSFNLTGSGMAVTLEPAGKVKWYATHRATTEAEARTWLNGKAGISA